MGSPGPQHTVPASLDEGGFMFVPFVSPSSRPPRRQRELQAAKIKAHASRVAYARKRRRGATGLDASSDPFAFLPTDLLVRHVVAEEAHSREWLVTTSDHLGSLVTSKEKSAAAVTVTDCGTLDENEDWETDLGPLPEEIRQELAPTAGRSSPVSILLGQGRCDPFNVFSVRDVKSHVHEILDHAVQEYWPSVATVQNEGRSVNPVCTAWFQSVMRDPLAFYCFIHAASLHRSYLLSDGGGPEALLLRLSYRTKAIRLLQESLRKGDPLTDDLIVSVASLAAHCPTTSGEFTRVQQISKSPLATAQSLDFHGSVSLSEAHSKALQRLMAQRGGVTTVRMTGLPAAIAYGELVQCTIRDEPPSIASQWSWPALAGDQLQELPLSTTNNTSSSSSSGEEQKELHRVMEQARAITDALEGYIQRRQKSSLPPTWQSNGLIPIIHWRNAIHHRLLSLARRAERIGMSRESIVYEACRIATLIYSNMVIFPLPVCSGVSGRLATQMRRALEAGDEVSAWEDEPFTLLWLTTMGGLAASTDGDEGNAAAAVAADRSWFIRRLKFLSAEVLQGSITSWAQCSDILESFLWWHHVCDDPGRFLWDDMSRSGESESWFDHGR